jgi:hypothetical protein
MNSQFESARHEKIRAVKDELREEAREYLKSGKVWRKMAEIIGSNGNLGDVVGRIITKETSASERKKIRQLAGVERLYNAERDGVVVVM